MNKKERRLALFSLLSIKAKNSNIKVIDGVNNEDVKTKNMVALFNNVVLGS
jgi:ribosomal protein L4